MARRFGVQINEFSIGMGPKIFAKRSKKTGILYSLRCLPIGGYVAMEGENGAEDDGDVSNASNAAPDKACAPDDSAPEGAASPADAHAEGARLPAFGYAEKAPQRNGVPFYTKPVWQRMLITAAGAVMNLLLGALLMTLLVILSPAFGGTQVAEIPANSSLAKSGVEVNDTILRVDGSRVYSASDLVYEVFSLTPDEGAELLIERPDGSRVTVKNVVFPIESEGGRRFRTVDFTLHPGGTQVAEIPAGSSLAKSGVQVGDTILRVDGTRVQSADALTNVLAALPVDEGAALLIEKPDGARVTVKNVIFPIESEEGRRFCTVDFKVYRVEKTFLSTCKMAYAQMRFSVKSVWESLIGLVTGKYGMNDVSGPVGVTSAIGDAAKEDFTAPRGKSDHRLLYLCALITVNLGIFNLLPLPALDGGRLFFQGIELIFRRPVPAKLEALVHFVGILLLLLLMLLITYKDIVRLF